MAQDVAEESLDSTGVEFVQALGEATNGNPFFLGEIVRSLKETGGVGRAARAATSPTAPTLGVPPSVRDAIAGRVASMGERAEQVLQAAAVIGREFDVELLARMLGVHEDQLVDVLDAADDAALITEVPGIGMRYSFVHPLIPPALYEQLGGGGRRRLHRQALDGLEQLLGDNARAQRGGELAYHALRASRSSVRRRRSAMRAKRVNRRSRSSPRRRRRGGLSTRWRCNSLRRPSAPPSTATRCCATC